METVAYGHGDGDRAGCAGPTQDQRVPAVLREEDKVAQPCARTAPIIPLLRLVEPELATKSGI